MISEKQLELLKKQITVVLSTSNLNSKPHAIFAEINKIENNSIVITDNHMQKTISNIKENDQAFILAYKDDYSQILNITGTIIYHENGDLLNYVKNLPDNNGYNPKGVIEFKITNVEEKNFEEDFKEKND